MTPHNLLLRWVLARTQNTPLEESGWLSCVLARTQNTPLKESGWLSCILARTWKPPPEQPEEQHQILTSLSDKKQGILRAETKWTENKQTPLMNRLRVSRQSKTNLSLGWHTSAAPWLCKSYNGPKIKDEGFLDSLNKWSLPPPTGLLQPTVA